MSKTGLIIKQEYLSRVKKRSFILMTFLSPLFFVAVLLVPYGLSQIPDDETQTITILDHTGLYEDMLKDSDKYHFTYQTGNEMPSAKKNDGEDSPYAYILITGNLLENAKNIAIFSDKQVNQDFSKLVNRQTGEYLTEKKLDSYGIPEIRQIIADSHINMDIPTIRMDEKGTETESSTTTATIIGIVSTCIIYMFLLLYGAQVMRGVMQEKTNRIVEVMVSSVKPFELMMGKIIGIGLVGLTQIFIWVVLLSTFLFSTGTLPGIMPGMNAGAIIQSENLLNGYPYGELIFYFILFFTGGYLLYSAIFAAIGSAVDNEADTQQFMLPVTMIIIIAFYAGISSAQNPEGPLAFWCSLIPFTSPIVMMVRLPFEVPFWQTGLSLIVLFLTAIACIWAAGRIYRTGILMYGKKVNFKDMITLIISGKSR